MRFRRLQSVANMRRFFEFIVAIVLLSWSVTRYPVDVYVSHVSNYLLNPLVNFVIGNAIVFLLLFIYRKNDAGLNSATNDMQYEYFHITEVPDRENNPIDRDVGDFVNLPSPMILASIDKTVDINIDVENNDQIVSVFENTDSDQVRCDLVNQLQRTKSVLLNYEGQDRARRKLKRSESDISSRAVSSFQMVDKMSSEEFKHTIEAYIAKHQRFLLAQKINE